MFGILMGSGRSERTAERRASIENPTVSLDDPEAWNQLYGEGVQSDAGVLVSHRGSLKLDPVWQAVTMISGDVAKLPLDVYIREEDDGREVDKYHPAWYLCRRVANPYVSAFVLWRRLMFHALLWGNGYLWIDRNLRGDPIGLYNLLPDRTGPEIRKGELLYATETMRSDGTPWLRALKAKDVFHLQGPGYELWEGEDPVALARNSFGLGIAAQKFTSRFFKNGVRTAGILEIPLGTTPKSADNLAEGFRKHHEGEENWFKTVILRDGSKFHQTSIPPNDAQMVETEEMQARNVARRFNMSPSRLGIKDSHGYSSKVEDNQQYLDTTLSPWLTGITSEGFMKLLSKKQQAADTHYLEHNTGALLTMNTLQRYQVYAIGLRNKVLLPNEARLMENLNPKPGGNTFLEAYGPGKQGAPGDNQTNQHTGDNAGGTGEKTASDSAGSKAARMRLIFCLTERARHKSKRSKAYLEWLDGGLKSFVDEGARAGVSPAEIAIFGQTLNGLADRAKSDEELARLVDEAATAFEVTLCS